MEIITIKKKGKLSVKIEFDKYGTYMCTKRSSHWTAHEIDKDMADIMINALTEYMKGKQ